jgi:hypothetical protein
VITIWLMAIIGANFEGGLPQTSVVDGLPVFRYHISVFGHQHLAHQRVEIIPWKIPVTGHRNPAKWRFIQCCRKGKINNFTQKYLFNSSSCCGAETTEEAAAACQLNLQLEDMGCCQRYSQSTAVSLVVTLNLKKLLITSNLSTHRPGMCLPCRAYHNTQLCCAFSVA